MMKKQEGSSLLMVLIVFSLLLISSMSFLRHTNISTLIAGNIAYKQAAAPTAEIAIAGATTFLDSITNLESNSGTQYFALAQALDANGLPSSVNWANIPETTVGNYNLQFVVERLCNGALPVADYALQCASSQASIGGSKKIGANNLTSNVLFYRVTVRATGPKGTLTFVQVILQR